MSTVRAPLAAVVAAGMIGATLAADVTSPPGICISDVDVLRDPGWPLEPTREDHHLGATMEYMCYPIAGVVKQYIHSGLDIYGAPYLSGGSYNCSAPYAVVQRAGYVHTLIDGYGTDNIVEIAVGDEYDIYAHLADGTFNPDIVEASASGTPVHAGQVIARLQEWPSDSHYTHLHYGIRHEPGAGPFYYLNPMRDVSPIEDDEAPRIKSIKFYDNETQTHCNHTDDTPCCAEDAVTRSWRQPHPDRPGCPIVHDRIDVVTEVADFHRVGQPAIPGDKLAPRRIRYKVCSEAEPKCSDWKVDYDFRRMPTEWGSGTSSVLGEPQVYSHFSVMRPAVSAANLAGQDRFFQVPSNSVVVDGEPDVRGEGSWPTALDPDGFYSVTVQAFDFAGNQSTRTVPVCIDNEGECQGKLLVRDCWRDNGAEPSPCNSLASPDVTARRVSFLPATSALSVCMTNIGCDPIHPQTRIGIRATSWLGPAYASDEYRVSEIEREARQLVGPADPLLPWRVGERRCAKWDDDDFLPLSGSVSVSVDMAGDLPHPVSGIKPDNNKAVINGEFPPP